MKHPRILDVLSAVTAVAPAHPRVEAWWYAPPQRLRLQGGIARARAEVPPLDLVVQGAAPLSTECAAIAAELSARLPRGRVSVRLHRGEAEERHLFRLLSGRQARPGGAAGVQELASGETA